MLLARAFQFFNLHVHRLVPSLVSGHLTAHSAEGQVQVQAPMPKRTKDGVMSDSSPTKRRKTKKGAFAMKPISWPPNELPVEIFTLIICYLPRSNIQSMRLVNKEFEEKVSEYLFKVVVVPFKPEIYGINSESSLSRASEARDMPQGAVMLQDKGMRVFQGFGRRIRKFAMSFEFDENKLANPPIKSDQEAITSFWGIYRWPYKKYNRYAQLEGLEQTADETRTMAKALRFIECAKELGLSIDGGLGWLAGPDVNQRVIDRGEKLVVFGESRFVPESKPKPARPGKGSRSSDPTSGSHGSSLYAAFERMLQEAGYRGETLEPSVRMLLETEDSIVSQDASHQSFDSYYSNSLSLEGFRRAIRAPRSLENGPMALNTEDSNPLASTVSDEEDLDIQDIQSPSLATFASNTKPKTESCSLKPNDLTNAQREMLLEIEWAQRAFMQSYAIAIIDNPSTFNNIEALTIARLPSRHLPTLRREDFWDSLPKLKKLSLIIIPDWRDVVKLPTSWVQDIKIPPSQAVSVVYQILQEQISHRKNITMLHFGWLCGGEQAPGLFSRNQHILAAPLVPKAMDMVNRSTAPAVLVLPHVEHLSFNNCWISPHIMSRFVSSLRVSACESLKLDSVSLTAPILVGAQPAPLNLHAGNAHHNVQQLAGQAAANNLMVNFQGLMAGQNVQVPPAAVVQPPPVNNTGTNDESWLEPRVGSWAHIIDFFTPGTTLATIRHSRNIGPEPPTRKPTMLKRVEFSSCGYVRLPLEFDQVSLDPPDAPAAHTNAITKRISEIEPHMMKPIDHALGTIVNHISPVEVSTLENAWHMDVGWGLSRLDLAAESRIDGIMNPGRGRFDGLIEAVQPVSSPTT
ncbi:hypothetical protein G7Y89_g2764 [Cudoniella acicularis]|uniref:F-box domain-containing protein n=1 Tax=Cudoniella acicularis TaxID=354080 RepID=A0A8H4W681_9HELO|nr:hypothetical protein G7Y89_g2764 [Cudoniella acicularis]